MSSFSVYNFSEALLRDDINISNSTYFHDYLEKYKEERLLLDNEEKNGWKILVLVEEEYVDKYYLKDYSKYYVEGFNKEEKFTERIHFFLTKHTKDGLEDLKKLPDNYFDLTMTDPPYGIGKMVSGTMSKARLHKTRYDEFEDSEEYVRDVVIPIIKECIRVSKRVIVTPGSKCMMLYPKPDSFGTLFSNSAKGMQLWGSMDSQPIFYYGRPHDIGKRIHRCSFEIYEQPSCKEHPCSKPINLWRKIIKLRTKEGDLVLDPFMGSGTTAVACKQLNRKWVGFEISKKYCELAKRRLSQKTLSEVSLLSSHD